MRKKHTINHNQTSERNNDIEEVRRKKSSSNNGNRAMIYRKFHFKVYFNTPDIARHTSKVFFSCVIPALRIWTARCRISLFQPFSIWCMRGLFFPVPHISRCIGWSGDLSQRQYIIHTLFLQPINYIRVLWVYVFVCKNSDAAKLWVLHSHTSLNARSTVASTLQTKQTKRHQQSTAKKMLHVWRMKLPLAVQYTLASK